MVKITNGNSVPFQGCPCSLLSLRDLMCPVEIRRLRHRPVPTRLLQAAARCRQAPAGGKRRISHPRRGAARAHAGSGGTGRSGAETLSRCSPIRNAG